MRIYTDLYRTFVEQHQLEPTHRDTIGDTTDAACCDLSVMTPFVKPVTRHSSSLPNATNCCVTDAEREMWKDLEEEMLRGSFVNISDLLLAIFILLMCGDCNLSTKADLQLLFNPTLPSRDQRFAILLNIHRLARDGQVKSRPLILKPEDRKQFLRPVLRPGHPWLSHTPFQDELISESTPTDQISVMLDRLGFVTDESQISYLQGLIRPLLPPELVNDVPTCMILPWIPETELAPSVQEIQFLLGPDMALLWVSILAYHRNSAHQSLVRKCLKPGMAEHLFSIAMHQFEDESSPPKKLAFLLVGFVINIHYFGKMSATNRIVHLPNRLQPEDQVSVWEAVVSYAQKMRQNDLLFRLIVGVPGPRAHKWEEFWGETCPANWRPYIEPSAVMDYTFEHSSEGDTEQGEVNLDVGRPRSWAIFGCFS